MTDRIVIEAATRTLQANRQWADQAIAQVSDEQLRVRLHKDTNSLVVIMKHVAGNLRSRWTNFLTEDGEKEWRNRDEEFVDTFTNRDEAQAYWDNGWASVFDSLGQLSDEDLSRTVTIRGEPHSVALALQRSLGHTCYHVGQIMLVARMLCADEWEVLTIPRGQSTNYNKQVWGAEAFGAESGDAT